MWSRLLLPLFTTLWLSLVHIGPLWLSIALKLQSLLGSQRRCHAEAHSSGQCIRALVLIFAALVLGRLYLSLQLVYSGVNTYICSLCTRAFVLLFAACEFGRLYSYLQLVYYGVCTYVCSLCICECGSGCIFTRGCDLHLLLASTTHHPSPTWKKFNASSCSFSYLQRIFHFCHNNR